MFDLSLSELFFFIIIALILLGPKELSKTFTSFRNNYFKIKSVINKIQDEIEKEVQINELKDNLKISESITEDIMSQIKKNLKNYDKEIIIKNVLSQKNNYISFYPCEKYKLKPYSIYYISNFYFKI